MEPEGKVPLNKAKNKIVQTYTEDMAQVLEDDKSGLIKKIIHGEEAHEEEKRNLSPESRKNKIFMFIGVFLLLASVATLAFFFSRRTVAPSVPVQQQFTPLIFTEKSTLVELAELKKAQIGEKILTEVNKTAVKAGGIEAIYPTLNKGPVGLRKFMALIESNFTPGNNDQFIDDNFLMGAFKNSDTTNSFFMLLKMRSIPDIFDPMHAWEPKMFSDLYGLFGIPLSPETKHLLTKNFEDGIVVNKNARILYDDENNIVMLYVFANDNSVIITNTENAAREIMLRLASSEIKK